MALTLKAIPYLPARQSRNLQSSPSPFLNLWLLAHSWKDQNLNTAHFTLPSGKHCWLNQGSQMQQFPDTLAY